MKKSDVMKLAETGFVSIARLEGELGLPRDKACRLLLLCFREGWLLPVVEAFAAPPVDGMPVQMKAAVADGSESWYAEELEQLRKLFGLDDPEEPAKAMTFNDVKLALGYSREDRANAVRSALKVLVEQQDNDLMSFTATAGGAFGHRPVIYGTSVEAIKNRNADLKIEAEDKKKNRKKGGNGPPSVPGD